MTISIMGALIHTDRAEAKKRILDALRAANGDRAKAAKESFNLTSPRSLYRWIERLDMWREVDELLRSNAFAVVPGPPRSRERILGKLIEARGNVPRAARALDMKPATLRQRVKDLKLEEEIARALGGGPEEASAAAS